MVKWLNGFCAVILNQVQDENPGYVIKKNLYAKYLVSVKSVISMLYLSRMLEKFVNICCQIKPLTCAFWSFAGSILSEVVIPNSSAYICEYTLW